MKENKYDDAAFFAQYSAMPRSVHGLAAAGEWHVLESMLPDVAGLRVLDLGCGFGWHCRYAAEHDAASVTGVDLSEKMLERARAESGPAVRYIRCAIEDFDAEAGSFDLVLSSLALHYVSDYAEICRRVKTWLAPGGQFIFSAEHPVFTAEGGQDWLRDAAGNIICWPVDRYFSEGSRGTCFLGQSVVKYHRTAASYVAGLLDAGFILTAAAEPQPAPGLLASVPGMTDELRRPMMLILSARNPAAAV